MIGSNAPLRRRAMTKPTRMSDERREEIRAKFEIELLAEIERLREELAIVQMCDKAKGERIERTERELAEAQRQVKYQEKLGIKAECDCAMWKQSAEAKQRIVSEVDKELAEVRKANERAAIKYEREIKGLRRRLEFAGRDHQVEVELAAAQQAKEQDDG